MPLLRGVALTTGFEYAPVYLHPVHQDDSDYSYVGQQSVEGHKCYVVAFAQIREAARLRARLTDGFVSSAVLLQGLVWIDATSFQIIRIHTTHDTMILDIPPREAAPPIR
jgi:hypothetical protein